MSMAHSTDRNAWPTRGNHTATADERMGAAIAPPARGVRRRTGERLLESADGAELPHRCACCGDSLELSAFRTLPGGVRYFVCREHLVSSVARILLGGLMVVIAGYALATGSVSGHTAKLAFCGIGLGGVTLAWFALPVRAGRSRDGWRTLRGICRTVVDDLDRWQDDDARSRDVNPEDPSAPDRHPVR